MIDYTPWPAIYHISSNSQKKQNYWAKNIESNICERIIIWGPSAKRCANPLSGCLRQLPLTLFLAGFFRQAPAVNPTKPIQSQLGAAMSTTA